MIASLRNKIAFVFAVGLFQISLVFLLIFVSEFNERYRELMVQRGDNAAEQLAFKTEKLLILGLYPQEFVGYKSLLDETIANAEGVSYAALSDSTDKHIFSAGESQQGSDSIPFIRREIQAPSGMEYTVLVGVDSELIEQKTLSFVKSVLLYSVLLSLISIVAVIFYLKFNLGKPLNLLIKKVENLDLDAITDTEWQLSARRDEIGIVANSFEKTIKKLSGSQQSLKESNAELTALTQELEARVRERTLELENANKLLKSLAHVDSLTGFLNRYSFNDLAENRFFDAIRNESSFALIVADLDGFKQVNDEFGHAAGDRILEAIGIRIAAFMRAEDSVFRMGGDEFVFLIEKYGSDDELELIVQKIRDMFCQPVELDGKALAFGVSMGVVSRKRHESCNLKKLLDLADKTMYKAKNGGKDYLISESYPTWVG